VAVGVERQRYLRVAEHLHDDAGINALSQQQRRAGVPQIVKPDIGQARRGQQRFELPRHVPRLEWRPNGAGEHETAVQPAPASGKSRLELDGE
jgi:hypothetical protein